MKLATIEKILDIQPIEGADKIVLATVLGWQVVIKKDEYKVGDLCIYIPIDTLVNSSNEWFNFLASSKDSMIWSRIKTAKIRGKYSQGLIIPTTCLELIIDPVIKLEEGLDVGELIGVKKYEKELLLVSFASSDDTSLSVPFPSDIIPITDEDNLKSNYQVLEELKNRKLYLTLKMDGSSMTILRINDKFSVCSRRLVLNKGAVMHQFVDNKKIKDQLDQIGRNVAIQGEFCGPKINCNQMGLKDYKYYVFTIRDLETNEYFSLDQIKDFCTQANLEHVPILQCLEPSDTLDININYLQQFANVQEYIHPNGKRVPAEGIVIRPCEPVFSHILGKSLSVKVINQNYRD
jgi:RNA ligase (TIGR02306 family)